MCLACRTYMFLFQAEDGIRDSSVTGVQTCAIPISSPDRELSHAAARGPHPASQPDQGRADPGLAGTQIGRASCRESVDLGGRRIIKKKKKRTKRTPADYKRKTESSSYRQDSRARE